MNPSSISSVLAIDIGGTKLAVGLVAPDGTVLEWVRCPTRTKDGPDVVLEQIFSLCDEVVSRSPHKVPDKIGVGCGGPLDTVRGLVQGPPNLPGWDDFPLVERLERRLKLPVTLENDANAAALAEHRYGAGRGFDHLVYLTLSTGIGGGVIVDGRLLRGKHGNAGELGHLQVEAGGVRCACGGQGCLEAYCSGTSLARRAREVAREHPESLLNSLTRDLEQLSAHTVLAALEAGDPATVALWNQTLEYLSAGLASIVHAFDPERIVLGGGLTHFGAHLFEPLRERLLSRTMPLLLGGVQVLPAALGDDVGLLGAAAAALAENPPRSFRSSTAHKPESV